MKKVLAVSVGRVKLRAMDDASTIGGSGKTINLTSKYVELENRARDLADEFRSTLVETLADSGKWEECQKAIRSRTRLRTGRLLKLIFSMDDAQLPEHDAAEVLKELGVEYCKLLADFYCLLKDENEENTAKKWKVAIFEEDSLSVLALVVFAMYVRSRRVAWRGKKIWEDSTLVNLRETSAFLSHRGSELDKDVVASIWHEMQTKPVRGLFFDEKSLEAGEANDLQMLVAALYCKHLVMLVSPTFASKEWPILEYCIGSIRYLHYTKVMVNMEGDSIAEDQYDSKFTTPRFVLFRAENPAHKKFLPGWIRNDPHVENLNGLKSIVLDFLPFPFEGTSTAVEVEGKRMPEMVDFIVKMIGKKLGSDVGNSKRAKVGGDEGKETVSPSTPPAVVEPKPKHPPNVPVSAAQRSSDTAVRDTRVIRTLKPIVRLNLEKELVRAGEFMMWGTAAVLGLNRQTIAGQSQGKDLHNYAHTIILRCLYRPVADIHDAMAEARNLMETCESEPSDPADDGKLIRELSEREKYKLECRLILTGEKAMWEAAAVLELQQQLVRAQTPGLEWGAYAHFILLGCLYRRKSEVISAINGVQ